MSTVEELIPITEQVLAWVAVERARDRVGDDELRRIELCALATREAAMLQRMYPAPDRPDVDTLEGEILAALPRSVDDPAWESPTAAKVRDLAARAREAEAEAEKSKDELENYAQQVAADHYFARAEAAEADRDRLRAALRAIENDARLLRSLLPNDSVAAKLADGIREGAGGGGGA